MKYIRFFEQLDMNDVPLVGGKNAALGYMMRTLRAQDIRIPHGFATTAHAYWRFLDVHHLRAPIAQLMSHVKDARDMRAILRVSKKIRVLMNACAVPDDIRAEILAAYNQLGGGQPLAVAVRSSATAEDLPTASFAGQQESFVNIHGEHALLISWVRCVSSLFTPRAIAYRLQKGFDYTKIALSVGIHRMVPASSAGVSFTLDPQTGFDEVVFISANYGFGEAVVQGLVNTDEFFVHKEMLKRGYKPILSTQCGTKKKKVVCAHPMGMKIVAVPRGQRVHFCLSPTDVLELARLSCVIENAYSKNAGHWMPMDIEWVKSSDDGQLYIVQARPETVHARESHKEISVWHVDAKKTPQVLLTGQAVGQQIMSARVRVVHTIKDCAQLQQGEILVAQKTDPDWTPALKRAGGVITDQGGRTCHAAIVSRELGIPAIVGTMCATTKLHTRQPVTLDCSRGEVGRIYAGAVAYQKKLIRTDKPHKSPVPYYLNIADPRRAFALNWLPVAGVGLARVEFIIANTIGVHPLAVIHPEKLDRKTRAHVRMLSEAYRSGKQFFVQTLAQEIATIAAAFWPKPVIVRLSDFKTNEYRTLCGGEFFETVEENPTLGLRGAARYASALYAPAFTLECEAVRCARNDKGFKNIQIMVPFVRSVQQARSVIKHLARTQLVRGVDDLKIIMMCETPANVLRIKEMAELFDGFSIGSNDLTQLTLGVDRDNAAIAQFFDERDTSVRDLISLAINNAHACNKIVGICGQAPSDFSKFAQWLIAQRIDYISLNPDAALRFLYVKPLRAPGMRKSHKRMCDIGSRR